MIEFDQVNQTIKDVHEAGSLLDTLIEFEGILDDLNLYAYKNWIEGEVIDGPRISRYWVETTLMYPSHLMPDPEGAMRLINHGCYVHFKKDKFIDSRKIKSPDDLEPSEDDSRVHKPKKKEFAVYLVKISMPKEFVSSMSTDKAVVNDIEVDPSEVDDAYDEELDSVKDDEEANDDQQ